MHRRRHTCIHAHIPACIHAHVHAYIHAYMHTYMPTYTVYPPPAWPPAPPQQMRLKLQAFLCFCQLEGPPYMQTRTHTCIHPPPANSAKTRSFPPYISGLSRRQILNSRKRLFFCSENSVSKFLIWSFAGELPCPGLLEQICVGERTQFWGLGGVGIVGQDSRS